jgi:hypothetical protein
MRYLWLKRLLLSWQRREEEPAYDPLNVAMIEECRVEEKLPSKKSSDHIEELYKVFLLLNTGDGDKNKVVWKILSKMVHIHVCPMETEQA